ncbi:TetR/AcrR family transcriptional regulator [Prolixibacteraceae bacterium JC049]|nr:TetR/AcrR family transcriptional regulator [Prolixibacteraceae bacterium JC049]
MTEKKNNIIQAALKLFTCTGFHACSTSKVAKQAKVSEGLIFKHFKNKEGLLQAILVEGEEKSKKLFYPILSAETPQQILKRTLELPFRIKGDDFEFWKLQYKLKWELEYDHSKKMQPLMDRLTEAFTALDYSNPEMEAQFLLYTLDGIAASLLKGALNNETELHDYLMNKYNV